MQDLKLITDLDLANKKILLRLDLNIPMTNNKVTDTSRIERIIPTIKHLIKEKAKIIIISHFARPKGKFNISMSLAPIIDHLNAFLPANNQAKFVVDCIGSEVKNAVENMEAGDILLLENLRFYPGEEKNNPEFAKKLAAHGDIFINDTFSCSHRDHASITGIAKLLPSAAGLLFAEEIANMHQNLSNPDTPFAAIIGGSKISSKLNLLKTLITQSDLLIIGGGMANTILKAQGYNIGKSLVEDKLINDAKEILKLSKAHNCKIILPEDVIIADNIQSRKCEITNIDKVPNDKMILDIGPETIHRINQELRNYKTIIWNGPLGVFEHPPFNIGTESVARIIAKLCQEGQTKAIAGGGDVISALRASGLSNSFTYLSTAGGAFLEWLEGKKIPGLKYLLK
jgi:phosphoglycerate kinase